MGKIISDPTPFDSVPAPDDVLIIMDEPSGTPETKKITVGQLLGYAEKVILKCEACGQWGAYQTPCKYCGYPIG